MEQIDPAEVRFDDRGLVPCVVQDWRTGEVLTVAYMNAEALERTRATGETHFWSRSREELWHKGEGSGQRAARARPARRLRRRRARRARRARRPGLPHRGADLLLPRAR
ncbi:MAG: phosphoribosyl-AMP cyclohydrolase [Thermoleophilaceae bacterium]